MKPKEIDPDIEYRWVSKPDPNNYNSTAGCYGCAFRRGWRCSPIPCHNYPNQVAELIEKKD